MSDKPRMPTAADWKTYRRSYRRVARMHARAQLRNFYTQHRQCNFEINGQTMTGSKIVASISSASDARLRAYNEATKRHRRGKR